MKRTRNIIARLSAFSLAFLQVLPGWARGSGTTAGLSLIEAPSARAYGLAESMVAVSNDISAFAYNPASLSNLRSGQASFLYQKGMIDDSYGHLMIGRPSMRGGLGLSIGYYNGGSIALSDGVGPVRTVNAQRDLTVSVGMAGRAGRVGWGVAGKYLSSELVEKYRASGYAADIGLSLAATPRLMFGAALQNLGPQLTYIQDGDNLPRVARFGAALSLPRRGFTTTLLANGAYRMTEKDFQPSIAIEIGVGGLALRTGIRRTANENEFTMGTGFLLGGSSIDYSIGIAKDVDTTHRISYSFRFGSVPGAAAAPLFVRAPVSAHPPMINQRPPTAEIQNMASTRTAPVNAASAAPARAVYRIDQVASVRRIAHTYTVRPGDTLASIAKDQYGDYRLWQRIYHANKYLITDPRSVEVGQKLVLPQ
jgi:hypothetical protein